MNFIIEICGSLSATSDCIALNEIESYDIDSNKLSISNLYAYDIVMNGIPAYWNREIWGKSNLNNNNTAYGVSSTIFLHRYYNIQITDKARINFETDNSCKTIKVYYGTSNDYRTPKVINLYKLKDNINEELDYYTVISNFNNYTNYYDLIDSIDTTNLGRLQPITFNIDKHSEILKSKVKETILNHELIQEYLIPCGAEE